MGNLLCGCLGPKFKVGDWVSVVRDGNRLGRKTVGQVTDIESKSIPDGGRDEQGVPNAETKYYYSIRTATQQPTARPAMVDQREEWLTPATAPVEKKPIGAEEEAQLASA
eukprot:COSAG06_NODE_914_length_11578_cov_31.792926_6_plen_110_part_00